MMEYGMEFAGWPNFFVGILGIGIAGGTIWALTQNKEKLAGVLFFGGGLVMIVLHQVFDLGDL
nr:hypothetical protein DWF04_16545 [Cereibacter sphaeroides f. sp. denitrificans]